jgi:hypothetical protein
MAARREHEQPFVLHMTDDRLVVPEPGIGFPSVICAGLLGWKAFLKVGHALYLSRYQHRLVKQEGWAFLLDDLNRYPKLGLLWAKP